MKAINEKLSWELDERFITEALQVATEMGAITLDIFDTALTRRVDSPIDIFAIVERALVDRLGSKAQGFAAQREEAESDARECARQARGAEEVDLDAIYLSLGERMPDMAEHCTFAKSLEMQTEAAHLLAVPDILELTRRLRADGIPFAFVSDMYLPSDFLAEVLAAAGYEGWSGLVVSSETGRTKASGRQWATVKGLAKAFHRIVHVGDDEHADLEMPRQHGVATLLYARARSERRAGAKLTPALVPYSLMRRDIELAGRSAAGLATAEADFWFRQGQVMGGVVLTSFLLWLVHRVGTHGIGRLYFCARDGSLMLRAWEAAGLGAKTGIPSRYFHISRRPLNLACGYVDSTPDRLSPFLLDFLTSIGPRPLPLSLILRRSRLEGNIDLQQDLLKEFGSMSALLSHQQVPQLRGVLARHSAFVHSCLEVEFSNLLAYLDQEEFGGSARIGMVDMGWHATMQRSLRRIVQQRGHPLSLVGFYYGLWPEAQSNRFGAGVIEAAFSSEFKKLEEQPEMAEAVAHLEELHSARHGSVMGYARKQGRWEPVCAHAPKEIEQFDRATRHFQAGAIETVATLFNDRQGPGGVVLGDMGPDVVRSALGATFLSPSAEEVQHLGRIGHCATFDHSHIEPLVSRNLPDELDQLRQEISASEWKTGTARSMLSNATDSMRPHIRAAIRELLAHRGGRYLRQFA